MEIFFVFPFFTYSHLYVHNSHFILFSNLQIQW